MAAAGSCCCNFTAARTVGTRYLCTAVSNGASRLTSSARRSASAVLPERAREREPTLFFGLDSIYAEVPGPRFCALGLPCPPQRSDGPNKQGTRKYLPDPKTASIPIVVTDLRNQGDPAELQPPIALARTRLA